MSHPEIGALPDLPGLPQCRYGHGALRPVGERSREVPVGFASPGFSRKGLLLNHFFGYEIWRCAHCSYLELHDLELAALAKAPQSADS